MIFGYYSEKAAAKYGVVVWSTADGTEVCVTSVGATENPIESGYLWDDAVCVGEFEQWCKGTLKTDYIYGHEKKTTFEKQGF